MVEASQRPADELSADDRKWLHDKYAALAAEESQLAGIRTSYSITIGAVLVTGLVIAVAGLTDHPSFLVTMVSLLAGFGLFQAMIWSLLLRHTLEAQGVWRDAAFQLEAIAPPIATSVPGQTTLPGGTAKAVDLTRPYAMHRIQFSPRAGSPPLTRLQASSLMLAMPTALVVLWLSVLLAVWSWYFLR